MTSDAYKRIRPNVMFTEVIENYVLSDLLLCLVYLPVYVNPTTPFGGVGTPYVVASSGDGCLDRITTKLLNEEED